MSDATKEKVRHTPGPWEVGWGDGLTGSRASWLVYLDDTGARYLPIKVSGEKQMVAAVIHSKGDLWAEADAHLIKAAPDMLEALKGLVEHCTLSSTAQVAAHNKALDAIAKAEGANDA